jgi:hypothetical protein
MASSLQNDERFVKWDLGSHWNWYLAGTAPRSLKGKAICRTDALSHVHRDWSWWQLCEWRARKRIHIGCSKNIHARPVLFVDSVYCCGIDLFRSFEVMHCFQILRFVSLSLINFHLSELDFKNCESFHECETRRAHNHEIFLKRGHTSRRNSFQTFTIFPRRFLDAFECLWTDQSFQDETYKCVEQASSMTT